VTFGAGKPLLRQSADVIPKKEEKEEHVVKVIGHKAALPPPQKFSWSDLDDFKPLK